MMCWKAHELTYRERKGEFSTAFAADELLIYAYNAVQYVLYTEGMPM